MSDRPERAVAVIRTGGVVVIPTDTVYGLAADGRSEAAARALYALKGRAEIQPTALLFAGVDLVVDALPDLPPTVVSVLSELLPGPYTFVVPNPAGRFAWLTGGRPSLGVRVPGGAGPGTAVLAGVGLLVATSANLPGGRDPRRLADVPAEIRAGAGAVVDGGELPGAASTVVDLTGATPVVLREGAVAAGVALARIAAAAGR